MQTTPPLQRCREIYAAVTVLLAILLSKTCYFGMAHIDVWQWIYFGVCAFGMVFVLWKPRQWVQPFLVVLPFLLLIAVNYAVHFRDMDLVMHTYELLGNAQTLFFTLLATCFVGRRRFATYYIGWMAIFAVVSLVCFSLTFLCPDALRDVGDRFMPIFEDHYWYSPYYTWGWGANGEFYTRNSGPFFEPGAYQGYLLIAVLFLLSDVDEGRIPHRARKWLFLLFVGTILTTASTTGYILLVLVLIFRARKIYGLFLEFPVWLRVVLAALVVGGTVVFVVLSRNVPDKINPDNGTFRGRFLHMTQGFYVCFDHPVFGYGYTFARDAMRESVGIGIDDSSGLTAMTYAYGIPFGLYYLFRLWRGTAAAFGLRRMWEKVFYFVLFILLNLTEGIWIMPVYLFLLFSDGTFFPAGKESLPLPSSLLYKRTRGNT